MTEEEFKALTPAEQQLLLTVESWLGTFYNELADIKRALDDLAGRSGTLEYVKTRTTAELLPLYELMKSREPGLTKKEFARRLGIKAPTLYTTTSRRNDNKRTN